MFTGSFTEVNPKIWTFSAFLYIFETKRLEGIFLKSLHVIFIMYIIMSETFINIDSLQYLEISRQTYATNLSKICVTTFTFSDVIVIFPIIHLSLNLSHLLNVKH